MQTSQSTLWIFAAVLMAVAGVLWLSMGNVIPGAAFIAAAGAFLVVAFKAPRRTVR